MKKVSVLALVVVSLFALGTRNLQAQPVDMELFVNFGLWTDKEFTFDPFFYTGGVNLDVHVTPTFMLSPECDVVFKGFKFDAIWLAPGVVLNVKYSMFFAGAGISRWFKLKGIDDDSDTLFKINAGVKGHKYRLAVYIETIFNEFFAKDQIYFGATLGFKF